MRAILRLLGAWLDYRDGRRNHPGWSEADWRGGVEARRRARLTGRGKRYGRWYKIRRKDGSWF